MINKGNNSEAMKKLELCNKKYNPLYSVFRTMCYHLYFFWFLLISIIINM